MERLVRWYSRRIVNVNVNILVAGAFALGITVVVMHLLVVLDWLGPLTGWIPDFGLDILGRKFAFSGPHFGVSGLTLIVDLVADVAVYYGLHWLANHAPRRAPRTISRAYEGLGFVRDATLVQFERALLSPILYIIALGLQNNLLHHGVSIAGATAAGFATGIACSRALHTLWMLRCERKAAMMPRGGGA